MQGTGSNLSPSKAPQMQFVPCHKNKRGYTFALFEKGCVIVNAQSFRFKNYLLDVRHLFPKRHWYFWSWMIAISTGITWIYH